MTTIATGSRSSLAIGKEATYGTPASVYYLLDINSESLEYKKKSIFSNAISGGRSRLKRHRREGNRSTEGAINIDSTIKGQLLLWEGALGSIAETQVDATSAYQKEFSFTPGELSSYTVVANRVNGIYQYPGLKVKSLQISGSQENPLKLNYTLIGNGVETKLVSAPAFTEALDNFFWVFDDCILTVDGQELIIEDFSLNVNNTYKENRYKDKIRRDLPFISRELSGSFKMDFEDTTQYEKYVNGAICSIVLTATGRNIEGQTNEKLIIELPFIQYSGKTPNISGKDAIQQELPFDVLADVGDDEMTVKIISTEQAA